MEILKEKKKKEAQHPVGFEPAAFRLVGQHTIRCATTTGQVKS